MDKKRFFGMTIYELILLIVSLAAVTGSFFFQVGDKNPLSLITSLFGVTGVLYVAKGNVVGQYIFIVYATLYTILSFMNAYYGECLISILTMIPSCIFSIVTWLRHPSEEKDVVEINHLSRTEYLLMGVAIVAITVVMYFILRAMNTAELFVSTISFVTSIGASYLLIRRCSLYAIFFIVNDLILITLWALAFLGGEPVLPNIIGFCVFLVNDSYGFYCWTRRDREQYKRSN